MMMMMMMCIVLLYACGFGQINILFYLQAKNDIAVCVQVILLYVCYHYNIVVTV